jgi:protein-disulfide isomerase
MKNLLGLALLLSMPAFAQTATNPAKATPVRDSSALKPPAGQRVAIVEFEDLECPYCAWAAPQVRAAATAYNVPLVHHDFLIQGHAWSRMAAIDARYLYEKVSPAMAANFRADVFANQRVISGPDDLQRFAAQWFQLHGVAMPFVVDPTQHCATEVQADCNLAMRMGLLHTPTIFVVTGKEWIEVSEPAELYAALDKAESDLKLGVAVRPSARR